MFQEVNESLEEDNFEDLKFIKSKAVSTRP